MSQTMSLDANQDRYSIPSDGRGAKCTYRAGSNAANTTYTATTIVDANATPWNQAFLGNPAGAFGNIAAGDLIVTADGFWATVLSTTGPGTVTIRPVPGCATGWRHVTDMARDGTVPAATNQCAVFSPSKLAGSRNPFATIVRQVVIHAKTGAADATFDVLLPTNAKVVPTTTLRASATQFSPTPIVMNLDVGVRGPFGLRCSDTTPTLSVQFSEVG